MLAASSALVRGLPAIRVSAVTVVEVMRGLRPEEREREDVKILFARFQVEAMDGAAADLAVKLLQKKNANERVCPRCLGSEHEHKCPKCGRLASSQQHLNDAVIAATADSRTAAVPVLYAFDGGVLSFAKYVSRFRIERPPAAFGPLFSRRT
jgi:PIN domain